MKEARAGAARAARVTLFHIMLAVVNVDDLKGVVGCLLTTPLYA